MKILPYFIFFLSFFLFSLYFNPYVTSDDVLNVLMADNYHLPHDIYCWGQDRGGTLIPLISQLFVFVGIGPLLSVSISNYLVLLLGYIGFSKLLKSDFTKALFTLLWFIPYERFVNISSFPIGMSYSLIGFSVLFLLKIIRENPEEIPIRMARYKNYVVILFVWGLAVWVSDLAFISILILFATLIIRQYKAKSPFFKEFIAIISIGLITISAFIFVLKSFATGITENYQTLNSFREILMAFQMVFNDVKEVLFLQTNEILVTTGAWVLVFFLLFLLASVIKKRKELISFENSWINFFFLDVIAILGVIFCAHWVFLNNMGRWYFVSTYISGTLLFLAFLDMQSAALSSRNKLLVVAGIAVVSLSSVLTPVLKLKGDYKPMSSRLAELDKLGKIGIIADYWDAYRCSMANPAQIKSTPHEGDDIKNPDLVSEVFNQPKLFLSRDMWFDTFPDTLTQFGVKLKKYKSEFLLGGSNLCEYKIIPPKRIYTLKDLKFEPSAYNKAGNDLQADKDRQDLTGKYIVFGPDISLLSGDYIVRYYCTSETNSSKDSHPIVLDISSGYGTNILYYEEIANDRIFGKEYIDIHFSTDQLQQHTEFRVLYKGFEKIKFSKIELIKCD